MSPIDEDDGRYRSIKLCQLITDRQIDSEISFEIRKLLEEGVLIDFQDQNRNKRTAIHVAVEKCDVICVKFLLQFKPSLEVKDEDGLTPVKLAESSGDQNILNALLNSTVDVVNESYVEVIDYESLTQQKIEAIKSRATFKVLKLTNCSSGNDVWMKLNDRDYTKTLNESTHLFFVAIETNETNSDNDHELMKKVLNIRRPMIIQLTTSSNEDTRIYFKDDKMKDFMEIIDTPLMTQEKFNEAVQLEAGSNLKLLVAALRSNLFGNFTGDLLNSKVNTNEGRTEAVNLFAKSNALCHRFFRLFDESPPQIDRIAATSSFKGDQSLLALLDLPFVPNDEKLKLTEYQQDILATVDSRGYNLLMMTAEQSNLDAVKLLIRCGCDFNHSDNYDKRSSDICMEVKAFDSLAELIEAGSPYPNNFRIDELDESSEAHERINKVIEATTLFHEHIEEGETEEVEKFIALYPHIKHAFDTNNKCALTVALESDEADIHSMLLSEGFEPGADDEYYTVLVKFEKKFKIRTAHRKYFKEAFNEPHLKRLLKMFRLSFGSKDRAKCSTIIRKMFDELNEIDEIIPILQICSLSEKLRIVFDFNCDSVADMDPTSASNASAVVYPVSGFVYVGAKNHETEFFNVIGALVHELTHYAMKLTYENGCKPYDDGDIEATNRFEAITEETKKICDENPSTDSIVSIVYSLYSEALWDIELIVRVPHLLAHYKMNPQTLDAAERIVSELFHFYRENTLKDVERQSKVLLQKYLIAKVNNVTGIARKIENLNVKFESVEIDLKSSVYVIASNAPQLTLAMLSQADCDDSHIFVTLEQVAIGNILDKIAKMNAKESSTALIVDCIGLTQKYQESLKKLIKSTKNVKTIALVMTEVESAKVKENFSKFESETLDHNWGELTESSKVHLLDQNVIFQGVEMKLNELVDPSSEAMNFFPLGELVDCKDFKVGNELHQTLPKFYISRKFIQRSQARGQEDSTQATADAKNFEELSQNESRMGAMIISDEAGSGKSVTLIEIAKSLHDAFPDRWLLFVDLKRHIEAFKSVENYEKIETFEDFIIQNILKSEPKFDRELFIQMFQAGKTFVLFDGFDEICPNYKDLVLHVLSLFEPESGNQLYITSRPHLEADLEGALGNFVFKLEDFSVESQTSFLRAYWRSVGLEICHEDFEVLSSRLLEKFNEISASKLVGLPLLMRMTAEIFEDSKQENFLHKVDSLSIASVFREFVEKHLSRWTNNENEISRSETVEFQMSGGVLEVHHNIALNHIFDDKFARFEMDESDAEKITRVGLIRYDKAEKSFQFIHETFAEYFVADFVWFHLNRKNRNPSHECSKAIEILIEVSVSNLFKVIRNFFDQTLEAMKFSPNEAFCKSVAKCLSEASKDRNNFDFLRESLGESAEHLSSLLLSIVKHFEKEILLEMLQSGATSNAAACGSKETVSILCDVITTCTDNPKEVYKYRGIWGGNVLLTATECNKNAGVLTTLCANLDFVLTKDEIKAMFQERGRRGQNIIAFASDTYGNGAVFPELLSLLPKYLSPDEMKRILSAVHYWNKNFFHAALAFSSNESLKLILAVVQANFDVEEQKTLFYQPANASNMFQYASQNKNEKIFKTLMEAIRDVLSSDEIKAMLLQKDSDGSNVLHIITAYQGNEIVLNELNSLLRERLSDDEIRRLLLDVNSKGQNCFRLAANSPSLSLQMFCHVIGDLLPIEDQTRLLQQSCHEIDIIRLACEGNAREIVPDEMIKDLLTKEYKIYRHGRNAFQETAYEGDADTWTKLISFAQARFSVDEMKSFLFSDSAKNCLHQAVSDNKNENVIEAICKTIKTVGLSVEDQKEIVTHKDSAGKNIFHLAAVSKTSSYKALHDGLSAILSKDEIKEMLKAKDSLGNNILCAHKKIPFHDLESRDLIAFLREVLTNYEIKNLLFEVDSEGRNFFHCTVERSTKFEIKSVSKAIKEILSQDEQKKFFGIKIPNVFHFAAKNSNSGIFLTTQGCLKGVLKESEIESLIQGKNSKN